MLIIECCSSPLMSDLCIFLINPTMAVDRYLAVPLRSLIGEISWFIAVCSALWLKLRLVFLNSLPVWCKIKGVGPTPPADRIIFSKLSFLSLVTFAASDKVEMSWSYLFESFQE